MDDYKIYPKQFKSSKIPVEKNRCFFLMPFSKEFDYIYGVIKNDMQESGFICNRADEISGSKPIMNKILTEIFKSQYIITDLTNYNPNVFYELGIAHAFKDSQNIIILKQKNCKIPFDITHLTYIDYDANNLKFLTSVIKTFIQENSYISDFHEVLNIKGIINLIHDNKDDFVYYLQTLLDNKLNIATRILNGETNELSDSDIEQFLFELQNIISKTIADRYFEYLQGVLHVYYEILTSCTAFPVTEFFVRNFLTDFFIKFNLTENDILSWKTDLILTLANKEKMINLTMSWIIQYFSRSKSGTIDLNRYKIENFLMTTNSIQINEVIKNAIMDKDCHIREHMADIIGEKKLYTAKSILYMQLEIENNFFTAASLITAAGKLDDEQGVLHINNWIKRNISEIKKTQQFFVLKHAYIAIKKLDTSVELNRLNEFNLHYGEFLKNYFIL